MFSRRFVSRNSTFSILLLPLCSRTNWIQHCCNEISKWISHKLHITRRSCACGSVAVSYENNNESSFTHSQNHIPTANTNTHTTAWMLPFAAHPHSLFIFCRLVRCIGIARIDCWGIFVVRSPDSQTASLSASFACEYDNMMPLCAFNAVSASFNIVRETATKHNAKTQSHPFRLCESHSTTTHIRSRSPLLLHFQIICDSNLQTDSSLARRWIGS